MSLLGQKTKSDFIPWDEMQSTVLKLERDGELKYALLIAVGCYVGLRISDLRILKWNDVLNQEYLNVTEKKTKKERRITIHPDLQEIVQRIYAKVNPDVNEYMFVNRFGDKPVSIQYINQKLKESFKKYGVDVSNISSHSLRKTLSRQIWRKNGCTDKALLLLSDLLNHSSISTTKRYLGIQEQEISNLYLSV